MNDRLYDDNGNPVRIKIRTEEELACLLEYTYEEGGQTINRYKAHGEGIGNVLPLRATEEVE